MSTDIQKQLVKHLADVHSIEEQALAQLRRAPEIAGDAKLASIFEQHLAETERQEKRVRGRLEAHGAEPSKLKDVLGKAGAMPMILFARFNPDTPGKLLDHAYSYEHMELAAYEILGRVAERAGDADTVSTARDIAAEEREMARRLEDGFDAAVAASLRDQNPDDLDEQLNSYLADAHAIEKQVISLLQAAPKILDAGRVADLFEQHLDETREHERRVRERLDARGSSPSRIKDVGMRLAGLGQGGFFAAQPDTPAKLTGFAFAHEFLEAGAYELLRRVAERASDEESALLAEGIAQQERQMGARLAECWDEVVDASLEAQGVAGSRP
jgi:ferritin-like metal-binding protein YciE